MTRFIFSLILLCATPALAGETLILKNGQKVDGEIVSNDGKEIKIDVNGRVVTYYVDQVEAIEKVVPAIIVKDEEQKQEVIQSAVEFGVADQILDVSVERKPRGSDIDVAGVPLGNEGVQFVSPEDDPAFRIKDPSEETPEERQRRESAERFYNER